MEAIHDLHIHVHVQCACLKGMGKDIQEQADKHVQLHQNAYLASCLR